MTKHELAKNIFEKGSYLCVGLDTDINKLPAHILKESSDPVFSFNKAIIDSTKDLCVAYKINTAFYESMGIKGWESLLRTAAYIPSTHFKIADAKRGDIGNTSHQYAKAFFETYHFDAVTVAPYMGKDSVEPFLQYPGKWIILLALTSNEGSHDFQLQQFSDNEFLYEKVIRQSQTWGNDGNLMYVIGATRTEQISHIREIAPEHFFLVPGVGFQGGNLREISKHGLNKHGGLLVNVSRSILYASNLENFAEEARTIALQYQIEMKEYLDEIPETD
jgi:orotidine-5'-phosphate decarboxylase